MITLYKLVWASTYASAFSMLCTEYARKHGSVHPSQIELDGFSSSAGDIASEAAIRAQTEYS